MALSWVSYTCIAILLASVYFRNRLRIRTSHVEREAEAEKPGRAKLNDGLSARGRQLRAKLIAAIPHIVITPENPTEFQELTNAYWDQKACEVKPSCVVRPRNVWELAQAVKILKREFDIRSEQAKQSGEGIEPVFAVRGGGHSPVAGASSIQGGVVMNLGLFNDITLAEDRKSVGIGAGCKWIQVSKALEEQNLAVAGGRNAAVGIAGLSLGGGLSFFSPRYGLVCSNMIEYEVVLADGSIETASATTNPDLWRALKGGSNNFGIVTRFTARTFPFTTIWSGFLYLPSFQYSKVLAAFSSSISRTIHDGTSSKRYDPNVSGPLASFTYQQQLGIQSISINLAHTAPPETSLHWPDYWRTSPFAKLWRLWSTCKVRTLSSATDELSVSNSRGRRQAFATTTVKNDVDTLHAVHKAYRDAIVTIKAHGIKKMSWTLVLQPLLPEWALKGDANPLGLDAGAEGEAWVVVSFTVSWALGKDDEVVMEITRSAIENVDGFARERGTACRFRYLNYCAGWQKPFESYGEDGLEFLRGVSRRADPDGLFQRGCVGGFKLGM
ncbi:FAD binding domain-containing protein [Decorospora gaudefroyi]|uniref:FAD binding domain-containing protein n=1 Tax=Decorospora gaudefroyi TaxID=184978 RepID=A0A6A5KKI2_9PLEO|nr:FAD binding domain-containing protein [Decorospora gaudefroyi]